MGAKTEIQWADATFNPWWGCQRVSSGCVNCYAETWAKRYGHNVWGPAKTTERRLFGEKHWSEPLKWNEQARKTSTRTRVFCASMADVFEDHPDVYAARRRLWETIEVTPHLDWLLLTKRPENIIRMLPSSWIARPRPTVWLGTSVEDQEQADKRIPELLKVPAAVRFLSCEPLLGPISLFDTSEGVLGGVAVIRDGGRSHAPSEPDEWVDTSYPGIDWVIVGGESGPCARPMHPNWARSLRDQCECAGVAYFFKQHGNWVSEAATPIGVPANSVDPERCRWVSPDGRSKDIGEGLLEEGDAFMYHVGKKAAGRLLDGQEHNQFPEVAL